MKKYQKAIAFFFTFIFLLFGSSVCVVQNLARYGNSHIEFYEMEQALDVAFVGSSHAYCGFNPEVLEEEYELKGYVFGSSNQSMLANYLWAKEAYDNNPYKVLVVEMMSAPMSHGDIEGDIRSLCGMAGTRHFYELALTYKRNVLNILFPIFLYHDEWEYWGEGKKVIEAQKEENNQSRGHVGLDSVAGKGYTELLVGQTTQEEAYLNFTYIDKIREFASEKGIQLIFVKTIMADNAVNEWNEQRHNTIRLYCEQYGIPFVDFNTKEYCEAAGLNIQMDVAEDLRHANKYGAEKMTRYLGKEYFKPVSVYENLD